MTEKQYYLISLSNLRDTGRFVAMEKDPKFLNPYLPSYCLFEIRYRNLDGLPVYEIREPSETQMDVTTNNMVNVIDYLKTRFPTFDVLVVP